MVEDDSIVSGVEIAIVICLAFLVMFEVVTFGIAYFAADEVECNWIWCTFTSERSQHRQECFQNGEQINCSNMVEFVKPYGVS